jgi:hypothetical protein
MTILARTRTVASKPARVSPAKSAFGAGLEPVEAPALPWERSIRTLLGCRGYDSFSTDAAVCWIISRGTLNACPVIQKSDWKTANDLVKTMAAPLPRKAVSRKAPTSKATATVPAIAIVETPAERHKREQFDVCDAVSQNRAVRIPLDSPHYASFVAAMNAPPMPRGFRDRLGRYVPTTGEDRFASAVFARLEDDRMDARWDAMAQESMQDEMLAIGACG